MAEAYDTAIRNRLNVISNFGPDATAGVRAIQNNNNVRMPVYNGGTPVRMPTYGGPGGPGYRGPRGNEDALIAFGKFLQGRGFRISENSHFNGGHPVTGGHVRGSKHYADRAIDVNFAPGTSRREQNAIDQIVGLAKNYGLRSIWRKPGHFNHAHFDF